MRTTSRAILVAWLGASALHARSAPAQDLDACIAANEKAVSETKAGKLLDERAALSQCSASTCPESVRSSCLQRLARLDRAIPSIVFAIKDAAGHDLDHATVTIDGAAKPRVVDGNAIQLDPGDHDFVFAAPGLPAVDRHLVLHANEQNRIERIVLGLPAAAPSPPVEGAPAPPSPEEGGSSAGSTQRTVGLAVAGAGIAGLVVGGIFAGLSITKHDTYEKDCGGAIGAPPNQCNQAGVNGERDAATEGTVSGVAFAAGGALLVAGATLFLLAPRAHMQVGVTPGGALIRGTF